MAIYRVCKTVIASAAVISTTMFTVGCSLEAAEVGSVPSAAAEAAGQSVPAGQNRPLEGRTEGQATAQSQAEPVKKRVSTNHDIYHSKTLEVPAGKPVPAIALRTDPDPVQGWNLYVGTANFTFEPQKVGGESSPSEGHAQLYINDKPMQRIYSTWTHLPELPPGTNKIRVTLNANGYETITTQNEPIEETVTVDVYDPNADAN